MRNLSKKRSKSKVEKGLVGGTYINDKGVIDIRPVPNNPLDDKIYIDTKDKKKWENYYKSHLLFDNNKKSSNTTCVEDLNGFISLFRKKYYSGNRKTFRQFMDDVEQLADTLD